MVKNRWFWFRKKKNIEKENFQKHFEHKIFSKIIGKKQKNKRITNKNLCEKTKQFKKRKHINFLFQKSLKKQNSIKVS